VALAATGAGNVVGPGTAFRSATTSSAAALLVAAEPTDSDNSLKGTLLGTAGTGPVGDPFVDGHGIVKVAAAMSASPVTLLQLPPIASVTMARRCASS
jgi:hypothetical protein